MTKTLLYNSNPSVNNADWHLIASNDFTKRSVDYLHQKYKLPSFITPYLMYKGINLNEFDIDSIRDNFSVVMQDTPLFNITPDEQDSNNNFQVKSVGEKQIKNIEYINIDTFDVKNNFFSARRALKLNHDDYGRNISIIMLN